MNFFNLILSRQARVDLGWPGEIRLLIRLGELRLPKQPLNCTQPYASTPTSELFPTVTSAA